jgi:hypothetical protein
MAKRAFDREADVCTGIALTLSELPLEFIDRHGLRRRIHERGGGEQEVRFLFRDPDRRLPVWRGDQLEVVRWGRPRGRRSRLPCTAWTWLETVESGFWAGAAAVEIPATAALSNGVWFLVRQGVRGLLVEDEDGVPTVYMVCEKASHYFKTMTGNSCMPVLIDQFI